VLRFVAAKLDHPHFVAFVAMSWKEMPIALYVHSLPALAMHQSALRAGNEIRSYPLAGTPPCRHPHGPRKRAVFPVCFHVPTILFHSSQPVAFGSTRNRGDTATAGRSLTCT